MAVVDVGGTSTRLGVLSPAGTLSAVERFPTPSPRLHPGAAVAVLQQSLFDELGRRLEALRGRHPDLRQGAISFGAVVTQDGVIENASVLWHCPARGLDVAGELGRRVPGLSWMVINDVAAAAWRHRAEGRFALITVSTGVGGKVFDERLATVHKLVLDDAGLGGEMGHVVVDPGLVAAGVARAIALAAARPEELRRSRLAAVAQGDPGRLGAADLGAAAAGGDPFAVSLLEEAGVPFCECGNLADLCSFSSGPALERLARREARCWPEAFRGSRLAALAGGDPAAIDTRVLAGAAAEGDPFALAVLAAGTRHLALRILQLAADLGLDKVLLTGGVPQGLGAPYAAALRANLVRLAHPSGFFTGWSEDALRGLVRLCPDPDHDSLIGAGRLVQERAGWAAAACKPVGEARLEIRLRERPRCGAEQVIARVLWSGICSTDLQIYRGDRGCEPGVPGHECVAEVLEVGSGVSGLAEGDLFTLNPNNPWDEHDKLGHSREGVFQEILVLEAGLLAKGQVVLLPAPARPEWVLLELLACVVHSQARLPADAWAGREVLVVGAGVTGLLHAALARLRGARRVLLANRSEAKLRLAAAAGLAAPADSLPLDGRTVAEIRERTGGRGVDTVVLALAGDGGPAATAQILPAVADGGAVLLFGGFLGPGVLEVDGTPVPAARLRSEGARMDVTAADGRRLVFAGSRGSQRADFEEARDLALSGRLDLGRLITHRIPFSSLPNALDELARHGTVEGRPALRVLVEMTSCGLPR